MLIIQEVLVSDDVVKKQFMCNLSACKGACCWEGDYGAPLEKEELSILEDNYSKIKPYLTKDGIEQIEAKGLYNYFKGMDDFGTTLLDNGACAYMTKDTNGTAKCGMEAAYNDGVSDFKKPISCHLYPIRVNNDENSSFEAMNYDKWEICDAACKLGEEHQMPLYQFVKEAIIRKYGLDFYEELHAAAQHLKAD